MSAALVGYGLIALTLVALAGMAVLFYRTLCRDGLLWGEDEGCAREGRDGDDAEAA